MKQPEITRNIWDTVGIVCLLNIICFGSFYLCSVYLTEVTLLGSPMSAFTSFIVGYFARPFGALIFGLRADLRGTERTLRECVLLLTCATAAMAFQNLPVNDTYFYAALRILQGMGLGGAYACMAVLIFELAPLEKKGRATSLLQSSVPIGYLTALLITIVIGVLFPEPLLESHAWRVAFCLPLLTYLSLRMFRPLTFQPPVSSLKPKDYLEQIKYVFRSTGHHWKLFVGPALLAIAVGNLAFTIVNFKFYFMKVILNMNPQVVDFSSAISTLLFLPFYFVGGWLLDHFNARKIIFIFAALATVLILPAFSFIEAMALKSPAPSAHQSWLHETTWEITSMLVVIGAVMAIPFGALIAFICRQFPHRMRCFMFALTYSIGSGVSGGLTHMYGAFSFYGKDATYNGLYLSVAICLSCLVLSFIFQPFKESKTQEAGTSPLS